MSIIRDYLVELQNYLPEFLRQDPEMKTLLEVESKEHRVQVEVLKDIQAQMFIESATWGLSLFEKNLGLQPNASDNYEQRRNRILIYLQQHKTVNKQFIEELFSRYVSGDSKIKVVEDNPNNTFWVIDTGGRIIYPEDLREAIETYKPAHLRYGLEMRRDIYMDDESKIRIGIASMFEGYNKILPAAPEGIESVLTAAVIPARTGLVRIGLDKPTKEEFTSKVGFSYGNFGQTTVNIDKEDLPEEFKEKTSRATTFVGIGTFLNGYTKISIAKVTPDKAAFGVGVLDISRGVRRITPASPEEAVARAGIATLYANNGRRTIPANLADLPQEFKEKNSHISIRATTTIARAGFIRISPKVSKDASAKVYAGANLAVTGYKIIGADLSDLQPTRKRRFHVGISHIGAISIG